MRCCARAFRTSSTHAWPTTCSRGSCSPTAAGTGCRPRSASTPTSGSRSRPSTGPGPMACPVSSMLEREVKLGAGPAFHLPNLEGVVEGAVVGQPEVLRMETVYHDTPDLRLRSEER